ncbi:hypothetical protein HispidOSU_008903, partial [Sigmodon hispidus]
EDPISSHFAQCTGQGPASSSRATNHFLPSQGTQEYALSSPEDREHSAQSPGTQEQSLSVTEILGPLQTSKGPKDISVATEETLEVQSSSPSMQVPVELSVCSLRSLGQCQCSQSTLENLPHMGENIESSHSAGEVTGALPLPPVFEEHSTSTQVASEIFPFGQGYLAPLKPSQGPLKHSMSYQPMPHTLKYVEGITPPSAHFSAIPQIYTNSLSIAGKAGTSSSAPRCLRTSASPQAMASLSWSDKRAGGLCLLEQRILKMANSEQGILVSPSISQASQWHFTSAQCSVGQGPFAQQTVEPSPPTI